MKTISLLFLILVTACGSPSKSTKPVINSTPRKEKPTVTTTVTKPTATTPSLPAGAAVGNYNGNAKPFYARVTNVNTTNGVTTIGFENKNIPKISIPKTYGGTVSPLQLQGFDRDLLLVTAKLEDPNFNKYFLYVLRNNQWKPVMNGFAIHKSNNPETLQVIRPNPEKPNELLRYYSVFDLDATSAAGYTWRLLEESIVKKNR